MKKQMVEKLVLASLFSIIGLVGLLGFQLPAKANFVGADQVLGQLDINGEPNFTQNNPDSSLINDYGINKPGGMAIDETNERLFVADTNNNRVLVFKLNPNATKLKDLTAQYVLGQPNFTSGLPNGNGDVYNGVNSRSFYNPTGLVFDAARNLLFVADSNNNRVLIFDVSVIENNEEAVAVFGQQNDFTRHDMGTSESSLTYPSALAYDGSRTLFIADTGNNRVLAVDVSNFIKLKSAFAVLGQSDFTSAVSGLSAANFYFPSSLSLESSNLFVLDRFNSRVLVFDISVIDNGENAVHVLGKPDFESPASSQLTPSNISGGVSILTVGRKLFVSQIQGQRVMVFDISEISDGEPAVSVLGQMNLNSNAFSTLPINRSSFHFLNGALAYFPGANKLYVADDGSNRILIFDIEQIIDGEPAQSVVGQVDAVGNTSFGQNHINSGFINGHGFEAGSAVDFDYISHRLFVADTGNNRVLVFNLDNNNNLVDYEADNVLGQSDFASASTPAFSTATANSLRNPVDVLFNSNNNTLYVADSGRVVVYDVSTITNGENAVAVLGKSNFTTYFNPSENQLATAANNAYPTSLAFDKIRNLLFVADGYRVLVFDVSDVTTGENAVYVLGQSDFGVFDREDGRNSFKYGSAKGLSYNSTDKILYVADTQNNRVLAFDVNTIENGEDAVAVLGQPDFYSYDPNQGQSGVGPASSGSLFAPSDTAYNATLKTLYVADTFNNRVLAFDVSIILNGESAIAVLGQPDFDARQINGRFGGVVSAAGLNNPGSVAFNAFNNNLYVSDGLNYRILNFKLLSLPPTSLANGSLGTPYNQAINPAVHNKGNINYGIVSGSLPPGLSFSETTRVISGTPSETGNFTFTIQASDTYLNSAHQVEFYYDQQVFSITITASNGTANLNVTKVETPSRIIAPSQANIELGKWSIAAANSNVTLRKITFQAVDPTTGAAMTNLGTFNSLALYDGTTLLATGSNVNSNIVFSGFSSVIVNGAAKVYTLKGNTAVSGIFSGNKTVSFVVKSDSLVDIDARDTTGVLLSFASINFNSVSNNGPTEFRFAASNPNLYHDVFPVISSVSFGNNLSLSPQAKLFKFTVSNAGTRDLKLTQTKISVQLAGLMPGGIINDFRLYEDNGAGQLGTYLAQNNIVVQADAVIPNAVGVIFNQTNDQNNLLDSLVVAPGASKTFIVTANTVNMLVGKTTGSITMLARIAGAKGWNGNSWNTGDLIYFYRPLNESQFLGPFSASDSYDADGVSGINGVELIYVIQ